MTGKDLLEGLGFVDEAFLEEMEECPVTRRRFRPLKAVVIAAALCALTVTACAVGVLFHNPTIIRDYNDFLEKAFDTAWTAAPSASGITAPNTGTPISLEELREAKTQKARGWLSEETMEGTVDHRYEWVSMEVLEEEGSPKSRLVYAQNGGVKTECVAENPLDLAAAATDSFRMDLSWLNQVYRYVPYGNCFYTIEDKEGTFVGEYLDVLYAKEDESAWFSLDVIRNMTNSNEDSHSFMLESDYDQLYRYTTDDGFAFVISTYGDCVWASSTTTHSTIGLYGGYLTTGEVEDILDSLNLYLNETP